MNRRGKIGAELNGRFRSWFNRRISSQSPIGRSRRRRAAILVLMLAAIVAVCALLRAKAAPVALSVSGIHTRGEVQALILRVAGEEIGGEYRDYCTATFAEDGSVSSVSVDASAVNAVSARVVEALERELSRFSVTSELPLGDLILPTFFSGSGPSLKIDSTVYAAVSGEVKSELTDAGINQTLHTLSLEIRVDLSIVCMGKEDSLEVISTLPLAEALVVGNTPGGLIV